MIILAKSYGFPLKQNAEEKLMPQKYGRL